MCFAYEKWSAEDLRVAGIQHPDYYVALAAESSKPLSR
jgi:hypothetical protein